MEILTSNTNRPYFREGTRSMKQDKAGMGDRGISVRVPMDTLKTRVSYNVPRRRCLQQDNDSEPGFPCPFERCELDRLRDR